MIPPPLEEALFPEMSLLAIVTEDITGEEVSEQAIPPPEP